MKLDCAEFYSKEPTEEMIVDLVRNNEKRGEFMILEADDGESFVQIAGEYDAANPDACVFTLEYREAGKSAPLYHAVNDVTAAEATEAASRSSETTLSCRKQKTRARASTRSTTHSRRQRPTR